MNGFEKQIEKYVSEESEREGKGMEYLRNNIPEIQRFESLDELKDLTLTEVKVITSDIMALRYSAKAPSLFPHVRKNMIDKGIVSKHNIVYHRFSEEGSKTEDLCKVIIYHYGAGLQIYADIHK